MGGEAENCSRYVNARYAAPNKLKIYVTENGCDVPGESQMDNLLRRWQPRAARSRSPHAMRKARAVNAITL